MLRKMHNQYRFVAGIQIQHVKMGLWSLIKSHNQVKIQRQEYDIPQTLLLPVNKTDLKADLFSQIDINFVSQELTGPLSNSHQSCQLGPLFLMSHDQSCRGLSLSLSPLPLLPTIFLSPTSINLSRGPKSQLCQSLMSGFELFKAIVSLYCILLINNTGIASFSSCTLLLCFNLSLRQQPVVD